MLFSNSVELAQWFLSMIFIIFVYAVEVYFLEKCELTLHFLETRSLKRSFAKLAKICRSESGEDDKVKVYRHFSLI